MNIFAISTNPVECAIALDDRRLNKMVLETAQLICTASHANRLPFRIPYAPTHVYHPCAKWASSKIDNLNWLCVYFDALCSEYTERTGREHACEGTMLSLIDNLVLYEFDANRPIEPSPFPNCAGNQSLDLCFKKYNVLEAYRLYLCARWVLEIKGFMASHPRAYYPRWTGRTMPAWANATVKAALLRHAN